MGEPVARARASFPAQPSSVRQARRLLRQVLTEHGRDHLLDVAELVLSEVVTNVILHAHTPYTVEVLLLADGAVRVEVHDHDPQLPVQRHHPRSATTGRGMELISALSTVCGTTSRGTDGKVIWFVVEGEPHRHDGADPEDLLAVWDIDLDQAARSASGPVPVALLGLPAGLWLQARAHHDAILRELALYAAVHRDAAPGPEELMHADRARAWVSSRVIAELERAGDGQGPPAAGAGPRDRWAPFLDVRLEVPADAAVSFRLLRSALDVAEQLARSGELLLAPGTPEVVAVRDWVCGQVVDQLDGGRPSAWQPDARGLTDPA